MSTRRRLEVLRVYENGRLATMPDNTPAQRELRKEVIDFILAIDEILSHKEEDDND